MIRCFAFIFIALATLTSNTASTPVRRSVAPTALQIVDRFINAVGGRAAWLKVKSQYGVGTMEVQGGSSVTF